jgi:hypothetical protein
MKRESLMKMMSGKFSIKCLSGQRLVIGEIRTIAFSFSAEQMLKELI